MANGAIWKTANIECRRIIIIIHIESTKFRVIVAADWLSVGVPFYLNDINIHAQQPRIKFNFAASQSWQKRETILLYKAIYIRWWATKENFRVCWYYLNQKSTKYMISLTEFFITCQVFIKPSAPTINDSINQNVVFIQACNRVAANTALIGVNENDEIVSAIASPVFASFQQRK